MTILSARFTSLAWASPPVGAAVEALTEAAIKFAVGDVQALDMEAAAQSFIQSVQELRIPCEECRGYCTWMDQEGAIYDPCDQCSGRGWVWAGRQLEA